VSVLLGLSENIVFILSSIKKFVGVYKYSLSSFSTSKISFQDSRAAHAYTLSYFFQMKTERIIV
jgi:hypothetical protein